MGNVANGSIILNFLYFTEARRLSIESQKHLRLEVGSIT